MLIVIPLVILGIVALRAVTTFGQDAMLNTIAERIVAAVQRDMFRSQIRLDIGAVNASHSGEMISNFLYDTTLLRNSITRGVAGLGKEMVSFIALAAVMFYEDWELTLISIVLLPAVAWVTQALSRSLRKASTRGMEETSVLSKALVRSALGTAHHQGLQSRRTCLGAGRPAGVPTPAIPAEGGAGAGRGRAGDRSDRRHCGGLDRRLTPAISTCTAGSNSTSSSPS